MSIAISQLVVRTNEAMRLAHAKLEIEESGREVAALQGQIAGGKDFISDLAAEFFLTQSFLDDIGDVSLTLPDASESYLEAIQADINELCASEPWKAVLGRIDERTENLKNHLLFAAEKSRDLDLCQARHKAHTEYKAFFEAVKNALERARAKSAEKKEELPFEDEGEKGVKK
jgi:hypothetical protein